MNVWVALFALLRILTGKRKLAFPGAPFIPDKGAWPDLLLARPSSLPRYGMIVGPLPTRGGTAVPEGMTSDVESAQDHLPDLRRPLPATSGVHGWNDRVPRMLESGEHAEPNHPHNTSGLVGHTCLGLDRFMAASPEPREVGGVP